MKDRNKALRKALHVSQDAICQRVGVKRSTVCTYEKGIRLPSDSVIAMICREFNVNEEWLRTGKGSMFTEVHRDEQIARFVGEILSEDDDFRRRFIAILAQMTPEEWKVIQAFAEKLAQKKEPTE